MGIREAVTVKEEEADEEKEGLCGPKEGHTTRVLEIQLRSTAVYS